MNALNINKVRSPYSTLYNADLI